MASLLSQLASNVKKATAVSNTVSAAAKKANQQANKTSTKAKVVANVANAVKNAVSTVSSVATQVSSGLKQTASKPAATTTGTTSKPTGTEEKVPEYKARELSPPPTMEEYLNSGFYSTSGIAALQEQLARYNRTDEQLRAEADAMYRPAFNMQQTEYQNQLAELGLSRDRDIQKLNSQYDRTLNQVMAGLNKQGMGRSSMVATRGVETENARNSAISETSYNYLQQENKLNSDLQRAEAEYALNVENKAAELRKQNDSQRIALMSQIAQMQQSGYSAYVNYLQNKEKQEIESEYTEYLSKYLNK